MAYKNRDNFSTFKGVFVNPTDHGLQMQWYATASANISECKGSIVVSLQSELHESHSKTL